MMLERKDVNLQDIISIKKALYFLVEDKMINNSSEVYDYMLLHEFTYEQATAGKQCVIDKIQPILDGLKE